MGMMLYNWHVMKKEKNTSNALKGHFKKAGVSSKKRIIEFRGFLQAYGGEPLKLGDVIKATDVFEEEEFIDAVGISRGKGFCGVMKRHGFKGAKESSHGQKHTNRAPGSVGEKGGAKVLKNTRMGGRTGGEQVKVKNLEVLKIIPEENIMVLKGSIPGARENYIILQK